MVDGVYTKKGIRRMEGVYGKSGVYLTTSDKRVATVATSKSRNGQ